MSSRAASTPVASMPRSWRMRQRTPWPQAMSMALSPGCKERRRRTPGMTTSRWYSLPDSPTSWSYQEATGPQSVVLAGWAGFLGFIRGISDFRFQRHRLAEFLGNGQFPRYALLRGGVSQFQQDGGEHEAAGGLLIAVERVVHDGRAAVGELGADLVFAAGLELHAQQRALAGRCLVVPHDDV